MAFDVALTSVMTGATPAQLARWRREKLLVPEVDLGRGRGYSFRDLLALRTMARLRSDVSAQKIRRAFDTLRELELTDHPSRYTLISSENSIRLVEGDERNFVVTDLVQNGKNTVLISLTDVMAPFVNFRGDSVVNFLRPRDHLEVREGRVGGIPTAEGTRVPFTVIAHLLEGGDVEPDRIREFYPRVSPQSALEALDFARSVRSSKGVAA